MIETDEPNVTVINSEHEAKSAKRLAWQAFMFQLAPTGFMVKPEYQIKWWGYTVDGFVNETKV